METALFRITPPFTPVSHRSLIIERERKKEQNVSQLEQKETEMLKRLLSIPFLRSIIHHPRLLQPTLLALPRFQSEERFLLSSWLWRVGNFPFCSFSTVDRNLAAGRSVGGFFAVISARYHPSAGGPMLCNRHRRHRYWKRISLLSRGDARGSIHVTRVSGHLLTRRIEHDSTGK